MDTKQILRTALLLFAGLVVLSFPISSVSAKDYHDQLFEDCGKGVQKACQEIEQFIQKNKVALDRLEKRAAGFQTKASKLGIQSGNVPNLHKAYPLVLQYIGPDFLGHRHD